MNDYPPLVNQIVTELGRCLAGVSAAQVSAFVAALDAAPRLFVAGAGRSGLAIRAFGMRLMHLGKTAFVAGETTTPGIAADDLLVIGSGSGRTASLLAAAHKAKSLGAKIALVTIDPRSPLGELADVIVQVPAPSPKAPGSETQASIQPMGALFEQSLLLLLDTVIVLLMRRAGLTSDRMFQRHANLE